MGRLKNIIFVFLFSQCADSKTEVPEVLNWYRQIELNLTDSFIIEGKDIPNDVHDWPIMEQEVLSAGKSGLYFMKLTNRLALVSDFPVISCFENTSARVHNGSKIIAVSRIPETLHDRNGRYALMQTSDPSAVWATWLDEEDAQTLFRSLGNFNPSKQPLLFPEVQERENNERLAEEREQKAIQEIIRQRNRRENKKPPVPGDMENPGNLKNPENSDQGYSVLQIWVAIPIFAGILMLWRWIYLKNRSPM